MEQHQETKIELQNKTDELKRMQKEVNVVDELKSVVSMLRQDLGKERRKCTELELQIHEAQNSAEDFQRQLTMVRKREDMQKMNLQELNYEVEKLRENEQSNNGSFISQGSIQQTMIQDYELKIASLQSQNDVLKTGNQEIINAKYMELENKLFETEKENNSLNGQIEQEKLKNKKLIQDFDQMVGTIQTGESNAKALTDSSTQQTILKNQKLEQKLRDVEHVKKENQELKVSRDKQQTEFKTLYEDKQKLYEDIMNFKDQVSAARSETKEKIMSIQFLEKEKHLLQKQVDEIQAQMKNQDDMNQQLQNTSRSLESKL